MQHFRNGVKAIGHFLVGETSTAPSTASAGDAQTEHSATSNRMPAAHLPSRPEHHSGRNKRGSFVPRYPKPRISEDEQRLCADYSVPTDAVKVPPPHAYRAFDQESEMVRPSKPGGYGSFKPVNTLDGASAKPKPRRQQMTYVATSRTPTADARLDFLDREEVHHFDHDLARSIKRRKVHHGSTFEVEDDEIVEVLDPVTQMYSPKASPSVDSRSQRSGDYVTNSQTRYRPLQSSAFQEASNLIEPRRQKNRRKSSPQSLRMGHGSSRRDSHGQQPIIDLDGDEDELSYSPQTKDLPVTSKHFNGTATASSRINTSGSRASADRSARRGSIRHSDKFNDTFERVPASDPIEDSEELAPGMTRKFSSHGDHAWSPPKSLASAKASSRGKTKPSCELGIRPGWKLTCVRSHSMEERGPDLYLLQRPRGSRTFLVEGLAGLAQPMTLATINLSRVTSAQSDGISRIRLTGGVPVDGDQYLYDLEFAHKGDLQEFLNGHVATACNRVYKKESDWMEKLFDIPLESRAKASAPNRSSPATHKSKPDMHAGSQSNGHHPEPGLIDRLMKTGGANGKENPTTVRNAASKVSSKPSGSPPHRPTRTTRNTKPLGDYSEPVVEKEPVKYSIEHGLGQPWTHPVQYNSGRHRAWVNFDDLLKLDEGECLNDALIEFYMIYLYDSAKIAPNKVYFFNTHFHEKLTQHVPGQKGAINYTGVQRWTAKEDIFKYDYIVVPVCESYHWYLAIICNVSNISRLPILNGLESNSPAPESAPIQPEKKTGDATDEGTVKDIQKLADSTTSDPSHLLTGKASDDEPNLFEEERRRGVEPTADNTIYDFDQASQFDVAAQVNGLNARESPTAAETVRLEKLSIADSAPKGILGTQSSPISAKKAGKRKPSSGKKYDPDEPVIIILDSLGVTHSKTSRALKDYILEEGRNKRSMEALITQNVVYPRESAIPMQPNYTDCGVYLLGYVQKFFENPREFVTKILTREMDPQRDWPDMDASKIRHKMRDILQEQNKLQHEQRKALKKSKKLQTGKTEPSSEAAQESAPKSAPTPAPPKPAPKSASPKQTPILLPAFELKSTPKKPAPVTSGVTPGRSPRKTSLRVVVETKPLDTKSPKRSAVRSPQLDKKLTGSDPTPKRQKLGESGHADVTLGKSLLQPRASQKANQASPRKNKTTAATSDPYAFTREEKSKRRETTQYSSPVRTVRGSSAAPIEIDDSQDAIQPEPVSARKQEKRREKSPWKEYQATAIPLPRHTKQPESVASQKSEYPKKVEITVESPVQGSRRSPPLDRRQAFPRYSDVEVPETQELDPEEPEAESEDDYRGIDVGDDMPHDMGTQIVADEGVGVVDLTEDEDAWDDREVPESPHGSEPPENIFD